MNPGLVVKLRPAGPWRIGPDSGARNRVDFIYHSDSLYSAVVSAMARLGSLDAWLDATARRGEDAPPPAVCFSSCFPFLGDIGFVVPPRTVWPPVSRALRSARVRWKSARFVPLGVVQAILAGQRLDENHWSVDGASECLVPAGKPGPFRTAVRWSAAVDRLTGSTERHSTACLEFRPGAGLWTVVSFLDEAAYSRWLDPVKAAFRLLADTGFGGERSRGWGRAESPEFIEGALPDMILPPSQSTASPQAPEASAEVEEPSATEPPVEVSQTAEPEVEASAIEPGVAATPSESDVAAAAPAVTGEQAPSPASLDATSGEELHPAIVAQQSGPEDVPVEEPPVDSPPNQDPETDLPREEPPTENPSVEEPPAEPSEPAEGTAAVRASSELATLAIDSGPEPPSELEPSAGTTVETVATPEPLSAASESGAIGTPEASTGSAPEVAPSLESQAQPEPASAAPQVTPAVPLVATPSVPGHPHWLLSLFTPSAADAVDWRRGNYTVMARGGRVDSPAGSGELKKQIQMVAEGSVVYAPNGPYGSAADVAPDGFTHPVFRAGFAVSIPLPEVS